MSVITSTGSNVPLSRATGSKTTTGATNQAAPETPSLLIDIYLCLDCGCNSLLATCPRCGSVFAGLLGRFPRVPLYLRRSLYVAT